AFMAQQALEESYEMAVVRAGAAQTRNGKVRVDARDVLDRPSLEVEDVSILTEVRDLEDAAPAAVVDKKRLVALTAEIARLASQPEELAGDRRDLLRREPRRRRLEHAFGCHGPSLRVGVVGVVQVDAVRLLDDVAAVDHDRLAG